MNPNYVDVFAFDDYRKFLDAYQTKRQVHDRLFTRSRFCRELGLPNTRSYFNDIVKGTRNISVNYVERFVTTLGMNKEEAEYFRILVFFNQSKYERELVQVLGPELSLKRWRDTGIFKELNQRLCRSATKWYLAHGKKIK